MIVLESADEIALAQAKLQEQVLAASAPSGRGGRYPVHDLTAFGIWARFRVDNKSRWVNEFGLEGSRSTAIEVNPPKVGRKRNCRGAFLRDAEGKVYLAHSGAISTRSTARRVDLIEAFAQHVTQDEEGDEFIVLGELGSTALLTTIAAVAQKVIELKETTQPPITLTWRDYAWPLLHERAEDAGIDVLLPLHWKAQPDHKVQALLVDADLRVRITQAIIDSVDRIPDSFAHGLRTDRHRKSWRYAVRAVRGNLGKTVSLSEYARGVCVPLASPERSSTSLNVYKSFLVDPKAPEFERLLTPEDRTELDAVLQESGQTMLPLNQFGHVLCRNSDGFADEPGDDPPGAEIDEGSGLDSVWTQHRNVIFFGPPGTGKSYLVKEIVSKHLNAQPAHVQRVTFHPESSYFDFVGSYRPAVGWLKTTASFTDADGVAQGREPRTYYRFEPGPFSRALALAARAPSEPVVLVIEEINRGNCAAIFGDVFQLLDRVGDAKRPEREGWSEYAIVPSAEWATWLEREIPAEAGVFDSVTRQLRLPGNLYLYATMNTSDQSLFPMDTAFRRRWGMSYQGVETSKQPTAKVRLHAADEDGVSWMKLMQALNGVIVDHTRSDDKQMGPWFIRPPVGEHLVDGVEFKSKVLFYLWATVFRDRPARVFRGEVATYEALLARYDQGRNVFQPEVLSQLGIDEDEEDDEDEGADADDADDDPDSDNALGA